MTQKTFPAVLELIHAAALDPAGWDGVLRRLASLTGCVAGGLTIERPETRKGVPVTYFGFDTAHVARSFDHYLPLNPLFGIESRMQPGFVVANADVVAPAVFKRSEFYNGWARPEGLCSPITVVIHRTKSVYVPLTLVRPDGAGEATAAGRALLSRLAPHLVHAMDVTTRLQAAAGARRTCAAMLDALPYGALLISRDQRIVFANAAARTLLDPSDMGTLACVAGKVIAHNPANDHRFQAVLAAALGLGNTARGGRLLLPHHSGEGWITITVTPMPAAGHAWNTLQDDAFAQARCMMLINSPNTAKLAQHYKLTPAEARVASAVSTGKGLTRAARELGIARSTAQSHLDKIFQKTGTNRQAELVGLIQAGLGL